MKLRNFLTALALTVSVLTAAAQSPKYIFYYIGDGMGMGPVMAAETYNRTILGNTDPLLMFQFPVVGWCATYSASSNITDSAAAGTALSTGHKTKNGMLGMGPDTTEVYSVALDLQKMGYGIGIATSVAPDDATPGAFYAHAANRKMREKIDRQMAKSGYQFLAGSQLCGTTDKDGNDNGVLKLFEKNNVQIVRGPEGIKNINSDKVLLLSTEGIGDSGNISYTIDSIAGALTLPQIATACLNQLEKTSPEKFFMMIEGGNIDHALHANDGGAAIKEILNFNEALAVAFNFYQQHPDETLIVVTADHDTGGMSMINPTKQGEGLKNIDFQRVSKEGFSKYCEGILKSRMIYKWQDMKEYLTENLGFYTHIKISAKQEEKLEKQFNDTFELRNSDDQKTLYANFNRFAVEVFRIFNDATGLAFTTTSHSGNPVPVFAVGVGAEKFRSYNNNIQIAPAILDTVKNGK